MASTDDVHRETRSRAVYGVIAVLTGILILAHIGVVSALPSPASYHEVAAFKAHQTVYVLLVLTAGAFTACAVVFLAGLPRLFEAESELVSVGAVAAVAAGLVVTTMGIVLSIGALDAIKQLPGGRGVYSKRRV